MAVNEDGRVPLAPGSHPSGQAGCAVCGASRFDPSRIAEAKAVLSKMIEDRSAWAANNQRMLDLLQPEWARFESRDGHNTYVARIYAEHTSSLRKDKKELAALEYALACLCDSDGSPKGGDAKQGSVEDDSAAPTGIAQGVDP